MGKIRNTTQSVREKLFNKFENRIKLIGEHNIGGRGNIYMCTVCDIEFKSRYDTIMVGEYGCKKCQRNSRRKTPEQYRREFENLHSDKLLLLNEYTTARDKIEVSCKICDYEWKSTPQLNLIGCRRCSGTIPKTQIEIELEIRTIHKNKLQINSEYKNNYTKIEVKCNVCEFEFSVKPHHLTVNKTGCPQCASAKNISETLVGEYVEEFLQHLGPYHRNFTPDFLKNENKKGRQQHLDYWFPESNVAIEYNGQQHYESIEAWGGEKQLKRQKINDLNKMRLCNENDVNLIIILYSEFNKNSSYSVGAKYFKNIAADTKIFLD